MHNLLKKQRRKDMARSIRMLKANVQNVATFKELESGEKVTIKGYNDMVTNGGIQVEKWTVKLAGFKAEIAARARQS